MDVVVIGGGITGTGIALDAASRGLRTVLVEREDLAFGTSRWSSKLVHGGLRYPATGHADVAWESAVERGHDDDDRPAPHSGTAADRSGDDRHVDALGGGDPGRLAGVFALARANSPPTSCPRALDLGTRCARSRPPCIDAHSLRGGVMAWDGQLNDDALGGCRSSHRRPSVHRSRPRWRQRTSTHGVRLHDRVSGTSVDVSASHVITATGVWAEELDPRVHATPSRGTHVVLDARRPRSPRAALDHSVPAWTPATASCYRDPMARFSPASPISAWITSTMSPKRPKKRSLGSCAR